jgi:hypothetical protein
MDNLGEDNPAIQKLGLQDEVDRLFNFTTAKPETIRQLLHNLSVKVTLFFAPKTMGNRAVKGRQWFVVDKGQVRLSIRGKPVVHPMPAKGDANRPIPETDCCRARPG